MNYHHLSPIITTFYSSPMVEKNLNLKKSRRHLIVRSRWRGAGLWPDARRDAGRIPEAGCARGTTTQPAKRAAALVYFFPIWPVEIRGTKSLHAAAGICEMASSFISILRKSYGMGCERSRSKPLRLESAWAVRRD